MNTDTNTDRTRRITRNQPTARPDRMALAKAAARMAAAADAATAATDGAKDTLQAIATDLGVETDPTVCKNHAAAGLDKLRGVYLSVGGAARGRRAECWGAILPKCKRGKVITGPLASVARRAVADALRGAEGIAVPLYGSWGDDGAPRFSRTETPGAVRVGYQPGTVIRDESALLVQAAAGLSCKGAAAGQTVKKIGKWATNYASAGEADAGSLDGVELRHVDATQAESTVRGATARRDKVLAYLSAAANADSPKAKKAAIKGARLAAAHGGYVQTTAKNLRRMTHNERAEATDRADAAPLEIPDAPAAAKTIKVPTARV